MVMLRPSAPVLLALLRDAIRRPLFCRKEVTSRAGDPLPRTR